MMKKVPLLLTSISLAVICCSCYAPGVSDADTAMVLEKSAAGKSRRAFAAREFDAPAAARANSADNSSQFKAEAGRSMAYVAHFSISVKLKKQAIADLKKLTESLGGYILHSDSSGDITAKVPVKNADNFLKSAEKHGEIFKISINAEDLTDTITDINVRLENLKKFRERLTALLAKTGKVEEILKIERELNRITTDMERLTANLQNNRNRVDFVTFSITVIEERGALPGSAPAAIDNFPFLKKLTTGMGGNCGEPLFDLEIPENFVTTEHGKYVSFDLYSATTADDCTLRMWEHKVPDAGTLEFWQQMVCRALAVYHSYTNIKTEAAKINGENAVKITAETLTASGMQNYMAFITVKENLFSKKLRIIEFAGPEKAFSKNVSAVTEKLCR